MDRCLIASIAIRITSDTNEGREQERERGNKKQETKNKKQDPDGIKDPGERVSMVKSEKHAGKVSTLYC